ncbi:DUF1643 domain-containing protein [Hwangdonia lutea]|uniref:DUF1643 domain-containing protein n=1 Tax=Hwangdonia lutea TaxID=3075823 RepID=A0AA97EQ47_9FLAO|nr:DUF1643 domain-containing protein [Hwangdonia sp. SCSIO 19198]WOD44185.1 DUF1643 domain-containing protein [Hwangdonia sp. SCSIO 19198]
MDKFLSIPEKDQDVRYLLGRKGLNNLLVICLNPSTADASKHDGTTSNVEKIATVNGFDGWVLLNITPQRTPYPCNLSIEEDKSLLTKNIDMLESIMLSNEFNFKSVLLAWGNNINSIQHPYLKKYAAIMLDLLKKYDLDYWCIKLTQENHPFHPAQQSINRYVGPVENIKLQTIDTNNYLKMLTKG